jgi:hypothetical protein
MIASATRFILAVEANASSLAQRKWLALILLGAISLTARALLLPTLPVPQPAIQDEFSYLLAADTFAHGRLANPTPPFPEHFETLQVLMHPTYASKYPPVSGLVMALGQKLTGQPWAGVWIAGGLLCAAITWALQGWLPAGWALAGGFIALLKIGIVSYWSESYWGGTCAAIGGALVIGALPRLIRAQRPGVVVAFAAGLAILANTRPYEGLALAVPCAGYLAFTLFRRLSFASLFRNVLAPAAALLIPVAAWMAYYNYRVTANPLEMPYLAHERQYAIQSSLLWQTKPSPRPAYSNALLEEFWTQADPHDKQEARDHPLKTHALDLFRLAGFFLGLPLTLCVLLFARALWRDRTIRGAILLLGTFYAFAAFDLRLFPHYAAPAAALAYIIAAASVRAARKFWPGGPAERALVPWIAMAAFATVALVGLLTANNQYLFGPIDYHRRAEWARVTNQLLETPGDHLVLVSYGPKHEIYQELVYNHADIAGSRVIWARSLTPESDRKLIQHFAGRRIWTLTEDGCVLLKFYGLGEEKSTITTQLAAPQVGLFTASPKPLP